MTHGVTPDTRDRTLPKVNFTSIPSLTDVTGLTLCNLINARYIAGTCSLTNDSLIGDYNDTCYTGIASSTDRGNIDRIFSNYAKALAAYIKLVVSKNAPFDKFMHGDEGAMATAAKRGAKIFIGKGNCVACHNGPGFTDNKVHNIGVPQDNGYVSANDEGHKSGVLALTSASTTGQHSMFRGDGPFSDNISFGTSRLAGLPTSVAELEAVNGAFRTPGLRSINLRGPFMHTGSFKTLWDVVNFYSFGGSASGFSGTKDGRITPRNLTNQEMLDLIAFLNALEGEALSATLTTRPTTLP